MKKLFWMLSWEPQGAPRQPEGVARQRTREQVGDDHHHHVGDDDHDGVHPNSHKYFFPYMGFCASIWDNVRHHCHRHHHHHHHQKWRCERTALEQILIRTPPPIIKQSHPGHPVHTGHPGFSVPVLHSVLQGRVYHRFGIFSFLMDAMTSEMRT